MTRPSAPSTRSTAMLLTDCPICDHPAPVDAATGDLDCAPCGVRLELAPDPSPVELPLAA